MTIQLSLSTEYGGMIYGLAGEGGIRSCNENNDNPFINPFDVMEEHGVQFDDMS